jgi:hypothetical protein
MISTYDAMTQNDIFLAKARILTVDDAPDNTLTFKLDLENRFGVSNATLKELIKPCSKSNTCPVLIHTVVNCYLIFIKLMLEGIYNDSGCSSLL